MLGCTSYTNCHLKHRVQHLTYLLSNACSRLLGTSGVRSLTGQLVLLLLLVPHSLGNTLVVKTHEAPSTSLRYLVSRGIAECTYIYRDPRDVAISAFENGRKLRSQGQETHVIARLHSIEDAILFANKLLPIWDRWMKCDNVTMYSM